MFRRACGLNGSKVGNSSAKGSEIGGSGAGTKRLAKASAGVLVLTVGVAVGVLYFGVKRQPAAVAEVINCLPPTLEAGPARPWESDIGVSTYSRVNTRTRNLFTAIPLAHVPMRGPDADIVLYHNSANVGATAPPTTNVGFNLGPGWTPPHSDQLVFGTYDATVLYANGTRDRFAWNGAVWVGAHGVYDYMFQPDPFQPIWHVVHKDQSYHVFVNNGDAVRLQSFCDSAGLCREPAYESLGLGVVRFESIGGIGTGIFDPWTGEEVTGAVKFHYDTAGRLVRIEDQHTGCPQYPDYELEPSGSDVCEQVRDWVLTYDGSDRVCKIQEPNGHFMYFWYDAPGRITAMTEYRMNLGTGDCGAPTPPWDAYVFTYDAEGRVVSVRDPDSTSDPDDGMTQSFAGSCGDLKVTTTYTDRRGSVWEYLYDGSQYGLFPDANLVRTKGPLVDSYTNRVFDINRNVLSVRDAVDKVWTATYDGSGNRLTWMDPLYHVQSWEYDTLNNLKAFVDALGNRTEYWYDLASYPTLLTRIIEPSTNDPETSQPSGTATTTLAYSSGLLASVTDPLGVVTTFEYDKWGQVKLYTEGEVPTQAAGGSSPGYAQNTRYDSAGRLVTKSTANYPGSYGLNHYNAGGNHTGSGCVALATTQEGGSNPSDFPVLPDTLTFSAVSAGYDTASFSPKGELLSLPMQLSTGAGDVNRSFSNSFDALGWIKARDESEGGVSRSFDYHYRVPDGLTYRCGSDPVTPEEAAGQAVCNASGVESVWERDEAGRVIFFHRGPAASPAMSAAYTYYDPLDLVHTVTYGNGASVEYQYDDANRVTSIHHRDGSGLTLMNLVYAWTDHDLPRLIEEWAGPSGRQAVTAFTYDTRKRLVREVRIGLGGYDLTYGYDQNGNRTKKMDAENNRRIEYHYDLENPSLYGSANNRVEYVDTIDTTGGGSVPLSRTWYYYNRAGNVTYVVTGPPSAGGTNYAMGSGSSGGGTETPVEMSGVSGAEEFLGAEPVEGAMELNSAGGGSMALLGSYCGIKKEFTALRLEYARNGEAVSYALGEHWCSNAAGTTPPTKYEVLWAREFRYDGARQRYRNAELDPGMLNAVPPAIAPLSITRSDYDGDDVYADWDEPTGGGGSPALLRSFEPGIARVEPWTGSGGANTAYYHTDMLGTTRLMTGADGLLLPAYGTQSNPTPATFTAFGERVQGPTDGTSNRYGYVGEHGYQAHAEFNWLHLGARYYDPAMGRFLQRDPIGIQGDINVYVYASGMPTAFTDPSGYAIYIDPIFWIKAGASVGKKYAEQLMGCGSRLGLFARPIDAAARGIGGAPDLARVGIAVDFRRKTLLDPDVDLDKGLDRWERERDGHVKPGAG